MWLRLYLGATLRNNSKLCHFALTMLQRAMLQRGTFSVGREKTACRGLPSAFVLFVKTHKYHMKGEKCKETNT